MATGLLLALVLLLAAGAETGAARDLGSRLARAEANVAKYESELPVQQQQVSAAEARYRAASRHAAPVVQTLRQSQHEVSQLSRDLSAQERKARTRIAEAESQHQQEVDDQAEQVHNGVGFGLAALVAGLIALGWGFFRASASVAALTELELSRAVGLCVGGGLLTLIVGVALGSSNGAVGALGSFIACLGLILPTAFLLARHSAEVQRGRSKSLLRRERLPSWVPLATAGLMLVLFLASTGSAVFAPGASSELLSSRLEEEAEGARGEHGSEELGAAQEEVAKAKQRAAAPLAQRNRAQQQLASVRRDLHRVQGHLAAAKSSQGTLSQRLVALEEKEQRELEKQEARLAREEQKRIEEEERTAAQQLASECDPNYNPCLEPASDYDCPGGSGDGPAYAPGPVEVVGTDIYGLDADGDGIGCEEE
jgi:Skp family chaperone for outer membrane proteins